MSSKGKNTITLKQKVYHLVEKGPHGSKINLAFDYGIMILIIVNIISMILETIPFIRASWGKILRYVEVVSVIIFTIEYILRLYVSDLTFPSRSHLKSSLKFIFSFYGLVDILAIAPFYLPFFIKLDLRYLRILRLLRFIRIFKINRYNNSLQLLGSVIAEKKTELAMTGFVSFIVIFIASFLMYSIEGEAQPEKFTNVLSCFWWAIATLTTVGYGDVYPITALGKFLSAIIAITGIGLVALPTGLISAGFIEKIGKPKKEIKKCPHCGKEIP